jgi:hypothetical protein
MVGGFESKQVTGDVWRTYGGEYGLFLFGRFPLVFFTAFFFSSIGLKRTGTIIDTLRTLSKV